MISMIKTTNVIKIMITIGKITLETRVKEDLSLEDKVREDLSQEVRAKEDHAKVLKEDRVKTLKTQDLAKRKV